MDVFLVFCMLWTFISVISGSIPASSIRHLYDNILTDYYTRVRPLQDQNDTVRFYTSIKPLSLVSLNTALQEMVMMGHFTFEWTDEFLTWNATKYYDVNRLKLLISDIWHPTVLLARPYSGRIRIGHVDDKVTVSSNGEIMWSTEEFFRTTCEIDITYYPFDTQECHITLYLSDETSDDVLLLPFETTERPQLDLENAEWKTLDIREEIYIVQNTQLLRYRFHFRRRSSFIMFTTIGPLLILVFLNSCVFLVPICSGEKGSIAITVFLSFSVYMSSIATVLPPNSLQTPMLQVFMMILEVNSALTMFYTIIESRLYNGSGSLQSIKLLSFNRQSGEEDEDQLKKNNASTKECFNSKGNHHNAFDRVDLKMCCISVSVNLAVVLAFAYKILTSNKDSF